MVNKNTHSHVATYIALFFWAFLFAAVLSAPHTVDNHGGCTQEEEAHNDVEGVTTISEATVTFKDTRTGITTTRIEQVKVITK